MRYSAAGLLFCVAAGGAACARPTLDDVGEPDARAMTTPEAGSPLQHPATDAQVQVTPPPRDGGSNPIIDSGLVMPPTVDAGKSDASTMTMSSSCPISPPPSSVTVGMSTVTDVRINGTSTTLAQVAPGASVAVTVHISFSGCSAYSAERLYVEAEGGTGPQCAATACTQVPVPGVGLAQEQDLELPTFVAPNEVGVHYLLAALETTAFQTSPNSIPICSGNSSSVTPTTQIAALCVSP